MLAEEILRNLHMDAGAVAGLAVGIDRTAVPQRLQRVDAGLDHRAVRHAVQRGDQPDAAGIMLPFRPAHAGHGEMRCVVLPLPDVALPDYVGTGRDSFNPASPRL